MAAAGHLQTVIFTFAWRDEEMKWIIPMVLISMFSAAGLVGYAHLVSKTRNDLLRVLLFVFALAACFLLPLYVMSLVFQWNRNGMTQTSRFVAFLIWMGGVWTVLIWRWKWFVEALSVPKK